MRKSAPSPEEHAYDTVPYESYPIFQSHPARLSAVAHIYGLAPPHLQTAHILELGCAAGGNIIPLAVQYPSAHFTGIDISGVHIQEGNQRIADLGLNNIILQKASISDLPPDTGSFDYIIAHGVYSWVPPEIRKALLGVIQKHLANQGIAYVSYNIFPGWHLKKIIRDLLFFHQATAKSAGQKSVSLRDFLSLIKSESTASYGEIVTEELETAIQSEDFFLAHDYLETWNAPCYFSEFLAEAKQYHLGYLSDADTLGTISERFTPEQIFKIQALSRNDPYLFEQYLDFLSGRMFRMSLLVQDSQLPLVRNTPLVSAFEKLHFMCPPLSLKQTSQDDNPLFAEIDALRQNHTEDFVKFPIIVRVIEYFLRTSQQARATMTLDEIIRASCITEPTPDETKDIRDLFVEMFRKRMLLIYSEPLGYTSSLEYPKAYPLARHDAERGRSFTSNPFHQKVSLGTIDHCILPLLDGTRDQPTLALDIQELLDTKKLPIEAAETENLVSLDQENQSQDILTCMLDRYIKAHLL